MNAAQVRVVSSWLRECDLTWNVSPTNEDAVALESALLAAWRPPINAAS